MVGAEMQRGRRALYAILPSTDFVKLRKRSPETYDLINRTLAEMEVMAFLVAKRYVALRLVDEFWGRVLISSVARARPFIEHRDEEAGQTIWPNLLRLVAQIESRRS